MARKGKTGEMSDMADVLNEDEKQYKTVYVIVASNADLPAEATGGKIEFSCNCRPIKFNENEEVVVEEDVYNALRNAIATDHIRTINPTTQHMEIIKRDRKRYHVELIEKRKVPVDVPSAIAQAEIIPDGDEIKNDSPGIV